MIVSIWVCSEPWLEWAGQPLILKCENNGNLKSAMPDRVQWRGSQSELFDTSRQKKKKKGFCQSQVELTDQESCWCISTILAITQARQKYFIYPRLTHETFHIVTSQITHCVSGGTQTLMFSYFSLLSLCLYRCLFNSKQTRAHTRWNYITALTVLRTLTVLLHIFAHWLQIIKTSQRLSSLCFQISVFVTRWQSLVH